MCYRNNEADFAHRTKYKPPKANTTRWSSTYQFLDRYVTIRDGIRMVVAVEDLLPRPRTHRQIVHLVNKLEALDSVCVKLQSEHRSQGDAMLLFDAAMAKYPTPPHHLDATANPNIAMP
ncbi:hypothetical protein JG688_00011814 [Phytophthora aleatoria]|uniref:Uncharacterized protein n=1 Tax=Phytophthora aleatoria TaxID=2496075 RepID=A0A8J5J3U2_9STRA|nr:hypothetical protein JG688_00011814 [Phytophthora aleatoria]